MSDEKRVTEVRRCGGEEWDKGTMKDSEGKKRENTRGEGSLRKQREVLD